MNESAFSALAIAIRRPIQIFSAGNVRYFNPVTENYVEIPRQTSLIELNGELFIKRLILSLNNLIFVGLFENGRIKGFRNLRINDSYDFT
jgi:hypothetical protein